MKKIYLPLSLAVLTAGLFLLLKGQGQRFIRGEKSERGVSFDDDEREDGAREALKQEVRMTKDPKLGYVPTERLLQYTEFMRTHPGLRVTGAGSRAVVTDGGSGNVVVLGSGDGLVWSERGPNNIGGRCRAILIDKSDATGNTVLVGSVSGGLWRTTNFTAANPTWTQNGTVLANLAITTLAQDPTNHSVMYAGTGEGYFNIDAIRGLGIYKSTDGGTTWSLLSSTTTGGANVNDFNFVQKVAVYSNGDVYASGISASICNTGGILKSTDGGSTWTRVTGTLPSGCGACGCVQAYNGYDIVFSSGGDIYASVTDGDGTGRILKSPAGASVGSSGSWTDVTPSTGTGLLWQRISLAVSPTNNSRVYAFIQDSATGGVGGIRRTDDGGTTWTNVNNNTTWCDGGSNNGKDFARGQAWYNLTIAVNPGNDAVVYAGGVDMMSTTNSGSNWAQVTQWASGCSSLPYVHADIHNISFMPGSTTSFIVGCDGGIFYTSDGGNSFVSKDGGLNVTQYYGAALHPTSGSNYMLAAAQDNGSHIFSGAGVNSVTYASTGDGVTCFIDQAAPTTQVTSATYANYFFSRDGGNSFSLGFTTATSTSGGDGRFLNPASYDNSAKKLYCGSKDRRLKRIDNVASGTATGTDITVSSNAQLEVSAVKVDPNTADNVWVAFSTADDANALQTPALYLVTAASTASPVATKMGSATLSAIPAGAYINSIDVEQGNANHLVMAVSNYGVASVWESTDHGNTWTSLDHNGVNLPDMPVYWAMIVPGSDNVNTGGANGGIMIATEMGVWSTSVSAGASTVWTENAGAMGNVSTRMLQYRSSDNTVVAATHGRGLFTTSITNVPLPLSFVSFAGEAKGMGNHLDWTVANEYNNKGFAIERSYGGGAGFTSIGFVSSVSTAFHASAGYSFTDSLVDLGRGAALYRLLQTDLDGKVTYSNTISIDRAASNKLVQYVSAAGNTLFLRINSGNDASALSLRIMDMSGRIVMARDIPYQSQSLDIGALARGIYVVRLLSKDGQQFAGRFQKF